jgi:hypothetical protein
VEWLKVKALSSSSSTANKTKQTNKKTEQGFCNEQEIDVNQNAMTEYLLDIHCQVLRVWEHV